MLNNNFTTIKCLTWVIFCVSLAVFSANAQPQPPKLNQDPEKAKFIISDIDNFWRAFDLAQKESLRERKIEIYQKEYFDKGSKGLKSFIKRRIQSADNLVKQIEMMPKYYTSIRASSLKVSKMIPQMLKSFQKLKRIYPDAVFPDVYFLIGRANSGGTFSDKGLLIGTEMYGLTNNSPQDELDDWFKAVLKPIEEIPGIVAHELIHYQQNFSSNKTLLEQSLKEGGADFVGQLISKQNINEKAYQYGRANEKKLWLEFKREMNSEETDKWIFNGGNIKDRPADLGYFIGFKICDAYYKKTKDKKQALKNILNITDANKFFRQTKYGQNI